MMTSYVLTLRKLRAYEKFTKTIEKATTTLAEELAMIEKEAARLHDEELLDL